MSMNQRLDIRQSQTLVMTPQLQQAIKLLQMSNLELGDFVAQEIEKNPLLERADESPEEGGESGLSALAAGPAPENSAAAPTAVEQETAPLSGDDMAVTGNDENWNADGSGGEEAFTPSHSGSFDDDAYCATSNDVFKYN